MTDALAEIQSMLMSEDHADGRARLSDWYAARVKGPPLAREQALRDLCAHLGVRSHQTRALFCLVAGALVESGIDAEPLAHAVIAPVMDALTTAKRFVALAANEPEDEEAEIWLGMKGIGRESIERIAAEDGEAVDAFVSLDSWYRPFVAALTRAPSALKQAQKNAELIALLTELDRASGGAHWMYLLVKTLMDEKLLVLVPELEQGWVVHVSGCVDNGQLTTLLSDPLDAALRSIGASGRAPKDVLDNARGLGPQQARGSYSASFHLYAWRAMDPAAGVPMNGRYEWLAPGGTGSMSFPADFLPADVPLLDGERVVLLVGPNAKTGMTFTRVLSATRTFSALAASLRAEPLSRADAKRWLARVVEACR